MKKYIILFSLFFATIIANAQVRMDAIKAGVNISPTVSWMTTNSNNINGTGSNLGFRIGVNADWYFQENYALSAGVAMLFNQGGTLQHKYGGTLLAKSELDNPAYKNMPDGVKIKYNLQLAELPISLKFRTQSFGYLRYFAEAPIITLGLVSQSRGTITGAYGGGLSQTASNQRIGNDVNFLMMSWGLGAGAYYEASESTILSAGLYYNQGFTDITTDNGTSNTPTGQVKENSKGTVRSLALRLGVTF
jgi:hypothetical protein